MHSLLTWIINGSLIATAVFVHYETLYSMARHMPNFSHVAPRYRVLLGVFVILVAHAVEIWVFALGYLLMIHLGLGNLFGMTGMLIGTGSVVSAALVHQSPNPEAASCCHGKYAPGSILRPGATSECPTKLAAGIR